MLDWLPPISKKDYLVLGVCVLAVFVIQYLGIGKDIGIWGWTMLGLGWVSACYLPMAYHVATITDSAISRRIRLFLSSGARCFATGETLGLVGSLLCGILEPSAWLSLALLTALFSIIMTICVYYVYGTRGTKTPTPSAEPVS